MPGRVFRSGQVQVVQNLRVLPACLHPRSRLGGDLSDRVAEALYLPVYDLSEPSAGPAAVLEALLSSRAADSMLVANLMSFMGSQLAAVQVRSCLRFGVCWQREAGRLGCRWFRGGGRERRPGRRSGLSKGTGSWPRPTAADRPPLLFPASPPQLSIASPLPQPVLPSTLAGRRARPQVELSDSEDEEQDAAWPAPRRPAAKQPRRAAYEPPATPARHPAMHPGLALPPAAPACAAAAACKPPPPPPASAAPTCSADSACTEVASCAAFPRPQARPVASAATSPPELGRDYEADAQCECMGPPRSKRPRAASPARSAPAGMRRARSVPRSLADMGDAGAY